MKIRKEAYRQPTWGRAATVPVNDLNGELGGMIDLKGVGHARSNIQLHKVDAVRSGSYIVIYFIYYFLLHMFICFIFN
jgi:hypothetical protein